MPWGGERDLETDKEGRRPRGRGRGIQVEESRGHRTGKGTESREERQEAGSGSRGGKGRPL